MQCHLLLKSKLRIDSRGIAMHLENLRINPWIDSASIYRPSPKIHWMLSEVYKQGFVFDKSYTNYKLAIFLCPSVLFYCFTSGFKLYLVQVLYFEQLGYFIACPRFISPFIDYFRQCLNSVLAPILFEWSLLCCQSLSLICVLSLTQLFSGFSVLMAALCTSTWISG